jgi:two-component system sensor histidine kinase KdpD
VDEDLNSYRERHGIEEQWETKERIVVALSGAPEDEHLLRRASRMAARVNGEIIGVHVRTIVRDGRASPVPEGLERARGLLQELNGQYAEVTGTDVAAALVSFARAENGTQLVLGHSDRSRLSEAVRGSVINRAVRAAGTLDVHVIPATEPASRGLPPSPRRRRPVSVPPRRLYLGWILGTVGVVLLGAGLSSLHSSLGLPGALLCMLIVVVATAALGGVEPAAAASVVAAVVAVYFFGGPTRGFTLDRPGDVVALIAFFVVAAMMSVLVHLSARRGLQVTRSRAEVEALARLAGAWALTGGATLPELVAEIRRTFDLDAVAILSPDDNGWLPVAFAGEPFPVRPVDAAFSADLDRGSVLVLAGPTLSAEDTRLVSAFVGQLRLAQERARLELEAASAAEMAKADRAHTALLAAVSHDLRTPLAAIKAAASSLLSDEVSFTPEDVRSLCETIDAEVDRLTALVSNLLDMSRLQAGALPLSVRPTAVEAVLYAAVAALSTGGSAIALDLDGALPLVKADPGLLERAVANVMANALAWSPVGMAVRVEAGAAGDRVDIRVIDQGPGIPPNQRNRVFVPFQRRDDGAGGRPNGIGLGLAVAKGFTEAMGGELSVEDTAGGGATLVFSLPRADS